MNTPNGKLTDPYGELEYAIGSADDFWCFDFFIHKDRTVTLHAVINSETGSFIQDAEPPVRIPAKEAVAAAKELTYQAMEWCCVNGVTHDTEGWNQSPCYFWRSVHCRLTKTGPAIRVPVEMVHRGIRTRNYL